MSKNFKEIFEIELKCWCYGLEKVDEKVDASVLHKVIKEFSPVLKEALQHKFEFSILEIAQSFVDAAKCRHLTREIVYYISSQLPAPFELNESENELLKNIILAAEKKYQGIQKRYQTKWENVASSSSTTVSLDGLSFPPKPV